MKYQPKPIDTSKVKLTPEILSLIEQLAENTHNHWSTKRMAEGWKYGPQRDDTRKEHPCLVAYEELPDSEKEYDRHITMETLKAIIALGYRIEKK